MDIKTVPGSDLFLNTDQDQIFFIICIQIRFFSNTEPEPTFLKNTNSGSDFLPIPDPDA